MPEKPVKLKDRKFISICIIFLKNYTLGKNKRIYSFQHVFNVEIEENLEFYITKSF